jgi:4,5-DOPA dioxygenase extradiol
MYPVLFVGHGTPLNAIEDNEFTKGWKEIAEKIPKPRTILVISAHWVTRKLKVHVSENPRTIHDFYYFPRELYEIKYEVAGDPRISEKVIELTNAKEDYTWGLDHGTWSVLNQMYPDQDIKVLQLSVDYYKKPEELFQIGKALRELRTEVMIVGSGNIVHNLRKADFCNEGGYNWAEKYDDFIRDKILEKDFDSIVNYQKIPESQLAFSTTEHFSPLLYVLGTVTEEDETHVFNNSCTFGSVSMTSYLFTQKENIE